ncbi:MAG: HIT domain-containing protein [Anaerolineae bacterium]
MWLLLELARSTVGRFIIGWVLTHMSFAIPLNRLRETGTLIAFHHPSPAYPVHILLVPKRALGSLMAVQSADADFLTDLFQAVQSLVAEFELEQAGYRLICNGGRYQDVPHLHFHLISGETKESSTNTFSD